MTELGDAGLTEPQIMSLSAHETPAAARVYVKRTELQRVAAAVSDGSFWSADKNGPSARVGMAEGIGVGMIFGSRS
jgi:hypothetical protein